MTRSSPSRNSHLTDRELATVLAALRLWQRAVPEKNPHVHSPLHFTTCRPLSNSEIDALCEKLNRAKR